MQPPKTPFLAVRALGQRMSGSSTDYDALLEMARGRDLVLLGEATHGTAEFYRMRAEITLRLIDEQGFDTVAIESDWPDAWRIDRFVQGDGTDDASSALDDFERFPVCSPAASRCHEWSTDGVLELTLSRRNRRQSAASSAQATHLSGPPINRGHASQRDAIRGRCASHSALDPGQQRSGVAAPTWTGNRC